VKAKINELETDSKNESVRDLYRDTSDLKKGHHPRTNIINMRRVV
jgi:hypothetical protein